MAIPRCDLTDLPADMCGHCRGSVSPEEEAAAHRKQLLAEGIWFAAAQPGFCSHCGDPFNIGAAIRWDPCTRGTWRAECCSVGAA